jgi:predicted ester cyclase
MDSSTLTDFYNRYIECLNERRIQDLDQFVNETLTYNHKRITRNDYQDMLAENISDIPDLFFDLDFIVASGNDIASRLKFICSPKGIFKGIAVNGKRVTFVEHVFYRLEENKISDVLSLIDTDAIRSQLHI